MGIFSFFNMYLFILIVSVLLCVVVMETSVNQYYKISMVSSNENPNQPALFLHGESPVWDAETQTLYFVDVHAQNIHKLNYITGKISTKHIGYGQVNVVSLISGSKRLLVSVRAALYLMDWAVAGDASLRLLASLDEGEPDNMINDGKADVEGRFWVGTKGPQIGDEVTPDHGTLYSVQQDTRAHVRAALRPVSISNGIAFALNNSLIYYIDSSTQKIEAFDFDSQKGEISGRRTIIDVTSYGYNDAIPDGMTIDSKGHLWVALMFGGAVLHIDPDKREVVYGYKLPVSRTTSVCWGGPDMDELFVTTGRDSATAIAEPLAGALFTIRSTGSRGVPTPAFRFDNADSY